MISAIGWINGLIFMGLSALHFYWAAGGRWSKMVVLPSRQGGDEKLFNPSVFSTIVVAGGLFLFGCVALGGGNILFRSLDSKYFLWSNLAVSVIFFARSVGDFRYVGFFKRIKDTVFARNDSRYYAPLSLFLSVNSFIIFLLG